MWFTPTEYQLVLKSTGILGTGNSPSNKISMVTQQSMFSIVSLQYSCLCCSVQTRLCIPGLSSKQSRYDTVNVRVCKSLSKRGCNETVVMFPIHTVYTLLRKLVEEFPEQNPIDSGTILQTIQRIYRLLLSIYITTCYCKVCAHERSLEGLRFLF